LALRPNWYENNPRSGGYGMAHPGSWSALRWILTLTWAVFLLQMAVPQIALYGGLRAWWPERLPMLDGRPPELSLNLFFPVQLITYALLHADFWHIFWNSLFLFFFAPELEAVYGRAGLFRLYIGGVILAGLAQWIWWLANGEPGLVIGASGGVFTVMVLFALRWPQRTLLIWGVLPVPVWAFVAFEVVGNVAGFLGGNAGTVSFLAHLGGAAYGLLWWKAGDFMDRWIRERKRERAMKEFQDEAVDRREMDRILAKIQSSGLSSLDPREREFLNRRSQQLRDQGR
jgi:membrane associated rhomboid family serine protease